MSITSLLNRACKQTAVYWGTPVEDGYGGKTFADPVEIACRWENTNEVIRTTDGKEIVCKAIVYLTQDVVQEGYLYLGTLEDLDSADEENPNQALNTYEIIRFDKVPSLGSITEFVRKAYL